MPPIAILDDFQTQLSGAITDTDTALSLDGTVPDDARDRLLYLRIEDNDGTGNPAGTNVEWVLAFVPSNGVSPLSLNTYGAGRAKSGTAAAAHADNSIVTAALPAAWLREQAGMGVPTLGMTPGYYFTPVISDGSNVQGNNQQGYWNAFRVPREVVITRMGVYVVSADGVQEGGADLALVIAQDRDSQPGKHIAYPGIINVDSPGFKEITGLSITLKPGITYLVGAAWYFTSGTAPLIRGRQIPNGGYTAVDDTNPSNGASWNGGAWYLLPPAGGPGPPTTWGDVYFVSNRTFCVLLRCDA